VFGPTTTTRHVYDVAAQHVISGAMEGVNGNLFLSGFIVVAFHIENKPPFCQKDDFRVCKRQTVDYHKFTNMPLIWPLWLLLFHRYNFCIWSD
jgi:hypothetical protein